jgi:NADH-quinone oxidoreductase subunit L
MSRTVYLTFFGKSRGASAGEHAEAVDAAHGDAHDVQAGHDAHAGAHAGPHESPWLITVPLIVLAFGAVTAGYLNAGFLPERWHNFTKWVQPVASGGSFPELREAAFSWVHALPSIGIVAAALVVGFGLSKLVYEQKRWFGLTRRNPVAGGVYKFLWNKYYLDALYEGVFAWGIAYPVARLANWFNQKILDGVVNGAGKTSVATGRWVYRWIDQRGVDGIVNGSAATARGAGGALRSTESGRIQQYASLLFGAAAVAAIALVLYVQSK